MVECMREPPQYTLTAIDARDLYGINDLGDAVGRNYEPTSDLFWTSLYLSADRWGLPAGIHEPAMGQGVSNRAYAINDHGRMVGFMHEENSLGVTLPYRYDVATANLEMLQLLGGDFSGYAFDIDAQDRAVGQSIKQITNGVEVRAVVWDASSVTDLGAILDSTYLYANAIVPLDPAYAVVGAAYSSSFDRIHAWLWLSAAQRGFAADMTDLEPDDPPEIGSQALDMNSSFHVVGSRGERAALWSLGEDACRRPGFNDLHDELPEDLLRLEASSVVNAINESNVAVGQVTYLDGLALVLEAIVWIGGYGYRLADLTDGDEFWELQAATAVNGSGVIVGWGIHNGDQAGQAFILTPTR